MLATLIACAVQAREISVEHDGLTLNATLRLAEGKSLADGVVLLTHGTLLHKDADTLSTLAEVFRERGVTTLTHTLSLGVDNRRGLYDCATPHRHRHADALDEIGAWLDWIERQGGNQVVLLGHSRGGSQAAWFAAERDRPNVSALVLLGPSTRGYENGYIKQHLATLARAYRLAPSEAAGISVLLHTGFLFCDRALVTPSSFISYYAPEPRRDTPFLLTAIRQPVLVIAAGDDQIVTDLPQQVVPYGNTELVVLDGADHFFRDLYADEVADEVIAFLRRHSDFPL